MIRDGQGPRIAGSKSCWTAKVDVHYKRLLKPIRVQGLWAWRRVAMALHEAGVPLQSGTVPVERIWSSADDMIPTKARTVTEGWFELLADLIYLRHNYRHFKAQTMPTWCRGDSVLAERLEELIELTKALRDQECSPAVAKLAEVFKP